MNNLKRRGFLQSLAILTTATAFPNNIPAIGSPVVTACTAGGSRFKISLNAYLFNEPLRSGKTNLEAVIEFCAAQNFDAIDLTGYYFPVTRKYLAMIIFFS